jgi:hypothetical protein
VEEIAVFRLVKPAHDQMRSLLPPRLARDFDDVLAMIEEAIPSWYDQGSRDRATAIVMGGWIEHQICEGVFSLPSVSHAKVARLIDLAEEFNDRDVRGHGHAATLVAKDILRALREDSDVSDEADKPASAGPAPASEPLARSLDVEELTARKRALDERLRLARKL